MNKRNFWAKKLQLSFVVVVVLFFGLGFFVFFWWLIGFGDMFQLNGGTK